MYDTSAFIRDMENPVLLKVIYIAIILTFVFLVSDLRKKSGMVPLVDRSLVRILKVCYAVAIIILIYGAINVNKFFALDHIALAPIVVGTAIVAKSKIDLKRSHTWAGYHSQTSQLVVRGIYSWIRHPLYTGIFYS